MLHLDPERLAALADDESTADERAHLAICESCSRELAAYTELRALAERAQHAPLAEPLTDWRTLSARLEDEGLVRQPGGVRAPTRRLGWLRAAAAVLLAAGGAAIGRATAGAPLPFTAHEAKTAIVPGASLASNTAADAGQSIVSVEDALLLMERASSEYRLAAAYIAAHDTAGREDDDVSRFRTRLAVFDRLSDVALDGVNRAPADPVVNQILISVRTGRAAALQQLNSSLPRGMTLASY